MEVLELTAPKVTAIIPCAGFGTRVKHILGENSFKENTIAPNGKPVLWQHLDIVYNYPGVEDVIVIINSQKDETLRTIKEWALNYVNESYRPSPERSVHEDPTKVNSYILTIRAINSLPIKHFQPHVEKGVLIRVPNICSMGKNIYIVSIGSDSYDTVITQNPKDTIMHIRKVLKGSLRAFDSDRDLLVTLPDMYYTDQKAVMTAIQDTDLINRKFKLCAINPRAYMTADPMQYGRVLIDQNSISGIVSVLDKEFAPNENTYSEVGLLYGQMDLMLDHNEWFYDSMLASDVEILPYIIESHVIDYGNPVNHLGSLDTDDEEIRDLEDETYDEEDLE